MVRNTALSICLVRRNLLNPAPLGLMSSALRALPSVEKLAQQLSRETGLAKAMVVGLIQKQSAEWRARLLSGSEATRDQITTAISEHVRSFSASRLRPVINGTGVCIHTNLGRSPLGNRAASALNEIATNYSNLEFDLPNGSRGKRAGYLERALAIVLETGAATAVNNCAAALVLTIRHLAKDGRDEVIVSRGELVEIGGGFRIPEVIETSGAKLKEVGATNKTHLDDYASAISDRTALVLKVHRSNFTIEGFTAEPSTEELRNLAQEHDIPLVEDLGSGSLLNTDELAPLDHEPTPVECLKRGVDLVLFSGDKLLGGPQAGIIAGRADLIAGIKKEPFFRAVRCDKLILTVLQECIDDYLAAQAGKLPDIPVLKFLSAPAEEIRERIEKVQSLVANSDLSLEIKECESSTGGGTMPKSAIPSFALQIIPQSCSATDLAARLRTNSPALVGYIANEAFYLDFRTIFPRQDASVVDVLSQPLC